MSTQPMNQNEAIHDTWDVPVKQGGEFKDFEVPPAGAIPARICAMVDVGTHEARTMKGEVYDRKTLILGFELGERDTQGKPFFMSKHYTLSLDLKSNLFAVAKALNGEPKIGDKLQPGWFANKPCLLQISHETKNKKGKERTYANIDSVGQPPRGFQTPPGSCVIWRVQDIGRTPMPDLSYLPPLWHESTGKVMTISEWIACSREMYAMGKTVMQVPNGKTAAEPMTQAEADRIASDVPF